MDEEKTDLKLRTDFADGEPRMHHLELGRRLGYVRERDIAKLIERLLRTGFLNESDICATVSQNSGGRGRPRTDHWLSEVACRIVTTQSGTEHAPRVTREVCELFVAVRRGHVAPALDTQALEKRLTAHIDASIAELQKKIEKQAEAANGQITALRRDTTFHGVISVSDHRLLTSRVRTVAALLVRVGERAGLKSATSFVYKDLESKLSWSPAGARWHGLPENLVAPAFQHLSREEGRLLKAVERLRQTGFPFGGNDDDSGAPCSP